MSEWMSERNKNDTYTLTDKMKHMYSTRALSELSDFDKTKQRNCEQKAIQNIEHSTAIS